MRRAIIIVLDSAGIGAMPDAAQYGDAGADTIGHIAAGYPGLKLPVLQKLGLGNIARLKGIAPAASPAGAYGKMAEKSQGKDTTVGHWEMAGVIKEKPFPVYPDGFPPDLIAKFEGVIGRKTLGNKAASGTAIIDEFGGEHLRTGFPIVYTSADSVFQIAAHEGVIPLPKLYRFCHLARQILQGKHGVARVIARPFIGSPGNFSRTPHRHDYSLPPPEPTLLDLLLQEGRRTYAVGKIDDIFSQRGISKFKTTSSNDDGMTKTIEAMKRPGFSLIFTNLVDFDMKYGHRRKLKEYALALIEFDRRLPEILGALAPEDILFLTADHGCDPSLERHTDHTREYVPLLVAGPPVKPGVNLGIRETFADLGQTVAEYAGIPPLKSGTSFLAQILK